MRINRFAATLAAAAFALTSYAGGTPVNVMVLQKIKPAPVYFSGKADTIESGKLAFAVDRGLIAETKKVGDIVIPSVFNAEGKIVEKGTPVGKVVNDRQIAMYRAAVMKLKMDQEALKQAADDVERDKKMEKAITKKQVDEHAIAMQQAKIQIEIDQANVLNAKADLDGTELIAPYSGIVTKITRGAGMGVGGTGDDFAEITRMNPIMVRIPLPSELVLEVDKNCIVSVYPPNYGKSVEAWTGISNVDNDTLFAFVRNEIVPNKKNLTPEQEKMPKAYLLFPVNKFYESDYTAQLNIPKDKLVRKTDNENLLAVPDFAIRTDDKGTYVLMAAGQEALNPEKPMSKEFIVQKVYIKIGNLRNPNFGPLKLVSLDDPASLKAYDILVVVGDKDIKDGDKVVYCRPMWLFRPGDIVKVNIPSLIKSGYYVPVSSIIHEGDGDNYVYTIVDNKLKLVKVDLTGTTFDYYSITGPGITDGSKIVIPADKKQASDFYDGMDVQVGSTLGVSPTLTQPHAKPICLPDPSTFFN